MGRWSALVVVFAVLLVPPVSAQTGEAELEVELSPQRVVVSVEEDRLLELRVDARLQCLPGQGDPRDLQGYFTSHGFRSHPVYWAVQPADFRARWQEQEDGLWVIDQSFEIRVYADTPAPERVAGEQESLLFINGGRSLDGNCSPAGYGWDSQSLPLTIVVPAAAGDDAEGPEVTSSSGDVFIMPFSALGVFLAVVLITYLIGRWERRRRS